MNIQTALDPLDLVRYSARREIPKKPPINKQPYAEYIKEITQKAADFINADPKQEFLYKNPNGWQLRKHVHKHRMYRKRKLTAKQTSRGGNITTSVSFAFMNDSSSTTSDISETDVEPWSLIEDFQFQLVVREINEFVQTWELSPATKFVVIGLNTIENKEPFGTRYFVEVHFSKPTPKCPNPLAVAKAYFEINVSDLLPKDYPVNVTYKFEGYESQFYAMGEKKMSSNKFQRQYVDSILQIKLAFYAEFCAVRHPLENLDQSDELAAEKKSDVKNYF